MANVTIRKWREKAGELERIHCDGPDGNDYTLCGFALEGEDGTEPLEEVARRRITCEQCIKVITFAKAIKAAHYVRP